MDLAFPTAPVIIAAIVVASESITLFLKLSLEFAVIAASRKNEELAACPQRS
jgi:hypothetical protein